MVESIRKKIFLFFWGGWDGREGEPKMMLLLSFLRNKKKKIFWGKLFGGTLPPNKKLFGGTLPPNKILFGGTVPPSKKLFGGTIPEIKMS